MKDLVIINDTDGDVDFCLYGYSDDTGAMLLQRLYVLMLSDNDDQYRSGEGYSLLKFLEGGNFPSDSVMNSVLAICCATALNTLDSEDRSVIKSFSGVCEDGVIVCELEFNDGTSVKGKLTND